MKKADKKQLAIRIMAIALAGLMVVSAVYILLLMLFG